MGDYNDLRQSAVTGVPEDKLHEKREPVYDFAQQPRDEGARNENPQRIINAYISPVDNKSIVLAIGHGAAELFTPKEALSVITSLSEVLRKMQ